jgi:hypothetical protein
MERASRSSAYTATRTDHPHVPPAKAPKAPGRSLCAHENVLVCLLLGACVGVSERAIEWSDWANRTGVGACSGTRWAYQRILTHPAAKLLDG